MSDAPGESEIDGFETVVGGAVQLFGGRVFKLVVTFAVQVLLARTLGAADYGTVVIAQMVLGIGGLVALAGLDQGLTRNVPHYGDDEPRARGVARAGLVIAFVSGLVVGGALVLAAPVVANRVFQTPTVTPLVRLAGLAIPFHLLSQVGVSLSRGAGDARAQFVVGQLLNPVLSLLFMGGLVLAGFGAVGAMVGLLLTIALGMVVALYIGIQALPFSLTGPSVPMYRSLFAFSLPLLFAAGMDFLISNTDTFLLVVLADPSDVGIYNVVYRIRQAGMFFFYPITYLLPPLLTRYWREDEHDTGTRLYQVASKWMVLLTTPVFLLFFLFPATVVRLSFGVDYLPGTAALRVLMVPVMVTVLLSANGAALVALGYNRVNLYVNTAVAGVNLVLNVLLIPRFGITGAAVASATALVARDVVYTALLYRWEGLQPFSAAMVRPYLGGVALAAVGYLGFVTVTTATPLRVVGVGLLYLAVYVPLVVALGAVEPEDERLLDRLEERAGVDLDPLRAAVGRFG